MKKIRMAGVGVLGALAVLATVRGMQARDKWAPPARPDRSDATLWAAPAGLAGYAWRSPRPRARLLLQHGYAEHAERYVDHYHALVPRLVEMGIDVFAFDMAGHGCSSGSRGVTDVRRMVDAHLAARRELAGGGLPLFVFGHSLGGLVTASSVARRPDDVAGVILSGPALPPASGRIVRFASSLVSSLLPGRAVSPLGDPSGISRIDAEVRAYLADPLNFQRPLPARLGATALAVAADLWPRLGGWTAPTLIVHGTADTYTSPEGSRDLADAIASTDKVLYLVEGGRHEPLNDLGRDEVLGMLLDWIGGRLLNGGAGSNAVKGHLS